MRGDLKTRDIEVVTAAVPGYAAAQAAVWYREDLAALKPDVAIVYLGWNDLGQYNPFGLRFKNEGLYQQPTIIGWLMRHIFLLRVPYYFTGLLEKRLPVSMSGLTPEEQQKVDAFSPTLYAESMNEIFSRLRSNGIRTYVIKFTSLLDIRDPNEVTRKKMLFPRNLGKKVSLYRALMEKYRLALVEVANKSTVRIIEVFPVPLDSQMAPLFTDTMHLGDEGAREFGFRLAREIVADMRSLREKKKLRNDPAHAAAQ